MTADLDTLLTALYVLIDDHVIPSGRRGPGRPKKLSDAELVCLAVAQVLLGARSEHHWLRLCYTRLGHLFPYLPHQPGYHKRAEGCRAAFGGDDGLPGPGGAVLVRPGAADRRHAGAVRRLPGDRQAVQVGGVGGLRLLRRAFPLVLGLKLYLVTTPDGMPTAWCLASPGIGEREVAAALLAQAAGTGALRPGLGAVWRSWCGHGESGCGSVALDEPLGDGGRETLAALGVPLLVPGRAPAARSRSLTTSPQSGQAHRNTPSCPLRWADRSAAYSQAASARLLPRCRASSATPGPRRPAPTTCSLPGPLDEHAHTGPGCALQGQGDPDACAGLGLLLGERCARPRRRLDNLRRPSCRRGAVRQR